MGLSAVVADVDGVYVAVTNDVRMMKRQMDKQRSYVVLSSVV